MGVLAHSSVVPSGVSVITIRYIVFVLMVLLVADVVLHIEHDLNEGDETDGKSEDTDDGNTFCT